MKPAEYGLVVVVAILLGLGIYRASHPESAVSSKPASSETKALPKQSWSYSQHTDEMTGQVSKTACLSSQNKLEFSPPYDGGSTGTLCFSKGATTMPDDISFQIDKGQILCSQGCHVYLKVDNVLLYPETAIPPSDGSSNLIFFQSVGFKDKMLAKVRGAKVVMLQVEYFREGSQVLTFEPDKPLDPSW